MIDYHCHLLPGLDDGPETIDESVEMAAALQKAGFTAVYCTPHLIKGCFDADNNAVRATAADLQKRLKAENIQLELFPGREYYLDEFLPDYLKDPLPLGETKYIMFEIPGHIPPDYVKETCFRISREGFVPMIAHPERCNLFTMPQKRETAWFRFTNSQRKAELSKPNGSSLLDYLKDLDCAFQGNLGSFIGVYGSEPQKTANILKNMEVYTHFGTDLHSRSGIKYLNRGLDVLDV